MFPTEIARYGLLDVDANGLKLMPYLADLSATIFLGRKFEDANVCHDQPVASTSQRDLNEPEVRYESE